jgi:thioredoxin reductase (NADPH)
MYNFLMQEGIFDVIIIGSGPAGLTAGIYTSRAFLKTLIIGGNPPGGQLTTTTEIENFPGFPKGISGNELINNMREQSKRFGCEFADENIKKIDGTFEKGFRVELETGVVYSGRTIIIATGACARWLGLPSEEKLKGRGVSVCSTCDGFFYKNKVVGVVGGGDVAMEEATFLTRFASKVYMFILEPEEKLFASKIMAQKAKSNPKIEMFYNVKISEVLGDSNVTGVMVSNLLDGKDNKYELQGLFLAIGRTPNTGFLKGFVELDSSGYVKTIDKTKTSIEGVFVAGDVGDAKYRQAIVASGMGGMAALDVEKFLERK